MGVNKTLMHSNKHDLWERYWCNSRVNIRSFDDCSSHTPHPTNQKYFGCCLTAGLDFCWGGILYLERTGVREMTIKRTRLCYWIARPVKPGVQSSNTSWVRFIVISHTYVLWRRTMHEWVMNIHYQTWIAQGRFINMIRTPSKQWGVCDNLHGAPRPAVDIYCKFGEFPNFIYGYLIEFSMFRLTNILHVQ